MAQLHTKILKIVKRFNKWESIIEYFVMMVKLHEN